MSRGVAPALAGKQKYKSELLLLATATSNAAEDDDDIAARRPIKDELPFPPLSSLSAKASSSLAAFLLKSTSSALPFTFTPWENKDSWKQKLCLVVRPFRRRLFL
jgi:hypothetical protein